MSLPAVPLTVPELNEFTAHIKWRHFSPLSPWQFHGLSPISSPGGEDDVGSCLQSPNPAHGASVCCIRLRTKQVGEVWRLESEVRFEHDMDLVSAAGWLQPRCGINLLKAAVPQMPRTFFLVSPLDSKLLWRFYGARPTTRKPAVCSDI